MTSVTKRTVGELLRHHRLQASLKQSELATELGYDTSHISRVERSERLPTREYLQQFIQVLQLSEAEGSEIFDLFEQATGTQTVPSPSQPKPTRRQDWGEAPDISIFYGRQKELDELEKWIVQDGCRVVALFGLGGMGKTTLVTKLAEQIQDEFEYVIWRSLRNVPSTLDILSDCIQFFSDQQPGDLPESVGQRISLLIDNLRNHRCLLILDNIESILQEGHRAGYYREGYETYGDLIRRLGETRHQSCLVLTTREKPGELASLEGETSPVRSLQLYGLDQKDGREMLQDRNLSGSEDAWTDLIHRYSGNPLALKIVSETVRELFSSNIADFLNEETAIFGGVYDILGQQFDRLSELERDILYWLTIEREDVTLEDLRKQIIRPISSRELLEAVSSLAQRSLVERSPVGFTLQNVVMEFVTGQFIEQVYDEISTETILLFHNHALISAQAKDYVRQSQIRLILKPLVDRLQAQLGQEGTEDKLNKVLTTLRETASPQQPGYAGGNILNMLIHLGSDISNYDFSHLTVWQAYLRDVVLHDVNFAHADLTKSVFMETFGGIFSITFSPDGKLLAAGTTDNEIRVWQAADRKQLLICQGHTAWVRSVVFSPNNDIFASGSSDHTIRLWDADTGQCLQTLRGHSDRVRSIAFSPDGATLVSGSDDQTIRLWDVQSGQQLELLQGHSNSVRSISFSPHSDQIVSGSEDRTVRLWNVETGQCHMILQGHLNKVDTVTFSPTETFVASGSADCTIRLWDVATGECLQELDEHTDRVRSIRFSPDGNMLVSGGYDRMVRLWDVHTGQNLKILRGHTNWVRSVAFSPDGQNVVSAGDDKTARLWDIQSGRCLDTLWGYTNQVWSIALSADGRRLASGSEDQIARLWDVNTGQCLNILKGHANRVNSVTFSPDGLTCASSSDDQTIRLWDVQTGQPLKTLLGHTGRVSVIGFSPDGNTLASGSSDQTVRLWDFNTGQCLNTLSGHANWVWSVTFSPDGQVLASCGDDQTIRLWDVSSGGNISILKNQVGRVSAVAFDPSGHVLASGGDDRSIWLWDVKTNQRLKILRDHTERVLSVVYSPDGATLASGSEDQTVKLWAAQTGSIVKTLKGHSGRVRSVAYTPDGKMLISCSDDGTIKLWSIQTGECLNTLRSDRPYERMDITGVAGLTEAQKAILKTLGAVENSEKGNIVSSEL